MDVCQSSTLERLTGTQRPAHGLAACQGHGDPIHPRIQHDLWDAVMVFGGGRAHRRAQMARVGAQPRLDAVRDGGVGSRHLLLRSSDAVRSGLGTRAHQGAVSTYDIGPNKCLPYSRDPFKRDTAHLGNLGNSRSIKVGFFCHQKSDIACRCHPERQAIFDDFPVPKERS